MSDPTEPRDDEAALAAVKRLDEQLHREYHEPERDVHGVEVPTRALAVDDLDQAGRRGEDLDDVAVADLTGGEIQHEDDDTA